MRILDWNIEWMNNWFVGGTQAAWRNTNAGIANVRALAQRVANVIRAIDPDVLTVQEGPSDRQEMQLFINDFLSGQNNQPLYDAFGGFDGVSQRTYTLVKRNGNFRNPQLTNDNVTLSMFDEWMADIDGDLLLESYEFTRNPLVLDGTIGNTNDTLRIINLHTKSKFVNQGEALWTDPNRRSEFILAAMKNRRRISTEGMHLRNYCDAILEANANSLIVVAGDFNDGPGFDYFESNYLTHGVADIILGSTYYPHLQFKHALVGTVPLNQLFTAIFDDFVDEINNRPILLDHIAVSPGLAPRINGARICHQEYQAEEDTSRPANARDRLVSDHRPVMVNIQ